jgi:hypothetical protein
MTHLPGKSNGEFDAITKFIRRFLLIMEKYYQQGIKMNRIGQMVTICP